MVSVIFYETIAGGQVVGAKISYDGKKYTCEGDKVYLDDLPPESESPRFIISIMQGLPYLYSGDYLRAEFIDSTKGGEGSGHYGHTGLSGTWGGSTSTGTAEPTKKPPAKKPSKRPPADDELSEADIRAQESSEEQKRVDLLEAMENTAIRNDMWDGGFTEHDRADLLKYTELNEDDLKYMFALPGARTTIRVQGVEEDSITIEIEWYDVDDDSEIGRAIREFSFWSGTCYNHSLHLEDEWQDRDLAASLYARQKARMTEWNYDSIRLEANITIGRYAWAKEGFKYSDPGAASYARTSLKHWLGQNGMRDLAKQHAGKIANLTDPYDFATFDIPGVTMKGRQISNAAVGPNYVMHLGKAFMLDRGGHGSWNGRYDL